MGPISSGRVPLAGVPPTPPLSPQHAYSSDLDPRDLAPSSAAVSRCSWLPLRELSGRLDAGVAGLCAGEPHTFGAGDPARAALPTPATAGEAGASPFGRSARRGGR